VEVPDESLQTQAWVRALPPSSFLIQHGSLDTYEKALAVKSTLPKKAQAKIVAAYRAGEDLAHFVIVSGPFASIGQAHDTLKHRDASKNSWVRMTRTLQQQLNAPTRAKESLP
jgi:septal ring-binding cell division protein DamX